MVQERHQRMSFFYRDAGKSLARPEREQAAPVKSAMGRGMD